MENKNLVITEFLKDIDSPQKLDFIKDILNASPYASAILNDKFQVILTNTRFKNLSIIDNIGDVIGKRPGKVLSCINKDKNGDCGESDSCNFCGILSAIKKTRAQAKKVINESRITTRVNGKLRSHDFKITSSPIYFNNKLYTLINLEDISSEKRKNTLENVFFHDILNRLGGFNGLIQLIKNNNKQTELVEYVEILETIGEMVVEDIQTQRYLKSAENESLILNIRDHSANEIIESVKKQTAFLPSINSLNISFKLISDNFKISTDSTLLKRILLNMTKNAIEASEKNGVITISAKKRDDNAIFSVKNEGYIPVDIQHQIFLRSFSTKGIGRGLGTYSMKLFGENYLKGKVFFISDKSEGTTFVIELPLQITEFSH